MTIFEDKAKNLNKLYRFFGGKIINEILNGFSFTESSFSSLLIRISLMQRDNNG